MEITSTTDPAQLYIIAEYKLEEKNNKKTSHCIKTFDDVTMKVHIVMLLLR